LSLRSAARLIATAACWAGLLGAAVPAAAAAPAHPRTPAAPAGLPVSAAALYAPQTGQFLYAANLDREVAIASTTKLMTALITLQHVHRLSTVFAQNDWYPAAADSQLGLVPGERMSVHDLLLAMMLPSDDDAAEDLADNVGHGSVARFVAMMNAEARRLGLRHTHYATPIGLDTPGNYSTAGDLARLAEYDLTHSRFFARIVALKSAVVVAGGHPQTIVNRNDLVARFPWIDGVKTGHTDQAGYVLVASGHRDGMSLISVVLGTPSEQERDATSLALLDYGFGGFALRRPVRAGEVLARPAVQDESQTRVPVVTAAGFAQVLRRADRLQVRVQVPRQLRAPLPAQAVVGTAEVVDSGRVLARIPLLVERGLAPVSGLTVAARFVTRPLTLLVIAGVGLGGFFWRGTRRRRRVHHQGGEVEAA
jgi:serine-type D-Ala-D-Ala carboxypeptidase (penicillin-binding protein 5/6)